MEGYGHLSWSVPYEPGTLSARGGYYGYGTEPVETRVETTGAPSALRLSPDRATIAADGRDVSVVTVSALDREGRPVPTADAPVEFAVEGAGRILGVGNGDPSSHEPDRVVAKVTTLPFIDFRESAAPTAENPREIRAEFDASRWKPAFKEPSSGARVVRGTLDARGLPNDATVRLLLRHFGASAVVYLNGQRLMTTEMKPDGSLPSVDLPRNALREGRNVLAVTATPYEDERTRERAQKVPPAVLRVETARPRWSRRLFNGLAQIIVQSTGEAGPIRLKATAAGLSHAEVIVTASTRSQ
jgi:beta-galactosidase